MPADTKKTPRELGFRMPPEWAPHSGTWLTWPYMQGDSFRDRYPHIFLLFRDLIRQLTKTEPVFLNVWDNSMKEQVMDHLGSPAIPNGRLECHHHPAYEPWCRDHGPVFVTHPTTRQKAVVNWGYNAWGEKYPPFDLDNLIPRKVGNVRDIPVFEPEMILEGGSVETNGEGLLLTTETCLLNPNRNPNLSRATIEQRLKDYLGVEDILWLGEGIAGDDTDGHVDDITRFANAHTIVTAVEPDPLDQNHAPLQDNLRRLQSFQTQAKSQFRIITLPMPAPIYEEGIRLPASYANFYIANEQVIVPTFNDPNDAKALAILQDVFPSRRVVGLDSRLLIWGLGSFHCLTQQEPAV